MNFAAIKYCDIANGVGVRTTLFVSGCRRGCPYCFNEEAWSFSAGEAFTGEVEKRILESLKPGYVTGLSVLGGEPMEPENQAGLAPFLERVKAAYPEKDIWMYSGFTWEELTGASEPHPPYRELPVTEDTERVLACLDVLVDGPFVQDLKDISLRFRGSSNQRLIDVPATRAAGEVVPWEDEPLFASHEM